MSSNIFHSVFLDSNLCVGCTTCIKRCPTQAIRVRDGKAHIKEDRCIDCGECIRVCPKGAKKAVSDPLALMDAYDIRVALPAPSLYGQFGAYYTPAQIFTALRAIGFDEVFDVAWGAHELTRVIRCLEPDSNLNPVISSACPVVVRLVQLRFPSLIPNLLRLLPPMEIAAREVRRRLAGEPSCEGKHVGIFFISPCTAKVTSIRSPLGYTASAINAVFSFSDVFMPLKRALVSGARILSDRESCLRRIEGLSDGFSWARSDGELEATGLRKAVSVDGIQNVIALFEEIDNGKMTDVPYVEALACPGGCVGGPMAVANPHVARTTVKTIAREEDYSRIGMACRLEDRGKPPEAARRDGEMLPDGDIAWECDIAPKPVMVLDTDMFKALQMAEKMETIVAGLPGLDCGACGAPDCRALAEDIVRGLADPDDCVILMKQKLASKS